MLSIVRSYQRSPLQARPLTITPHYLRTSFSSALVEWGETKVLCTTSLSESVPEWMKKSPAHAGKGWLTAEYSMLPGSSPSRITREREHVSGRTLEIQRLIGRSLRAITNLALLGERTLIVDCDVLQADGGTRTASITGAYVALYLAMQRLIQSGKITELPLQSQVAAISLGILDGNILVDLDYSEDSQAEVDLNVVFTNKEQLVEIQGTAEKNPFSRRELNTMLDAAYQALQPIFAEQQRACNIPFPA